MIRWLLTAAALLLTAAASDLRGIAQQLTFGRFSGPIQVQFLNNGPMDRRVRLLVDVTYIDPAGKKWTAPKGFVSDGASIPQAFWTFVGAPLDGAYRDAAIIHDRYCETKTEPWKDVHRIFYYANRAVGIPELRAKVLYTAVRYGGPKWGDNKSKCSLVCHSADEVIKRDPRGLPFIVPKTTDKDVDRLVKWVNSDNPSLDEIDAFIEREFPNASFVDPLSRK